MQARRPFTLIELLTVIAIIAILVGLLLPAIGAAKQKAKITQAKSQIKALQIAIKQYESTYGSLPYAGTDDTEIGSTAYATLIRTLSCQGTPTTDFNPRQIVFLEVQTASVYNDPWGNRFYVYIDTNYDGKIELAKSGILNSSNDIYASVAIYSWGPNLRDDHGQYLGTGVDDVTSWGN